MKVPRWLRWALVALVGIGSIYAAVHRDPWDPDETRYLQVARETLHGGNPLFLRFNGEPYTDKPPPYFWLLVPCVAALGADHALAGVIPSLLAFVLLALLMPRLGRAAGLGPPARELATLLTVCTLLTCALALVCRMDLVFLLTTTLALERLLCLADISHPPSPATDELTRRRRRDHLWLWLWIGLGVLVKGPLALALPLLTVLILLPSDRRLAAHVLGGWGPLLAVGLVAAWVVPSTVLAGRQWFMTVVVHQTGGRLASSFAHREPWWYHLATVPITLFPCSALVPPAALAAARDWRRLRPGLRVLLVYQALTLVLLSLVSGKTLLYPLPLFPAAAALSAWWLTGTPRRGGRIPLLAAACGAFLVGAALAIFVVHQPYLHLQPVAAGLVGGSLALPAVAVLWLAWRQRTRGAVLVLLAAAPLFVGLGLQPVISAFDRLLSLRPLAAAFDELGPPPPSAPVAFGKLQPGYVLFTDTRFELVTDPASLRAALANGRVAVINRKDADRLAQQDGPFWQVLAEVPYRRTAILLIAADSTQATAHPKAL